MLDLCFVRAIDEHFLYLTLSAVDTEAIARLDAMFEIQPQRRVSLQILLFYCDVQVYRLHKDDIVIEEGSTRPPEAAKASQKGGKKGRRRGGEKRLKNTVTYS